MTDDVYADYLNDLIINLQSITKDSTIYTNGEFYRGYRAALYAVLSHIEQQLISFEISSETLGLAGFSAEDWYRQGQGYWK